jgi:hypothetical protein
MAIMGTVVISKERTSPVVFHCSIEVSRAGDRSTPVLSHRFLTVFPNSRLVRWSCGTLVVVEQSAQLLVSMHVTSRVSGRRPRDQGIAESLVISLAMVVLHELCDRAPEMALPQRNDSLETSLF